MLDSEYKELVQKIKNVTYGQEALIFYQNLYNYSIFDQAFEIQNYEKI